MVKRKQNHDLPGSIYKNGNGSWWKAKLPGDEKPNIPSTQTCWLKASHQRLQCGSGMCQS